MIFEIVFYFLLALLLISYVFYPIYISILPGKPRGSIYQFPEDSKIHLVIACYNEELVIEDKIRNSFAIEYPLECFVYVVIDQSSDGTLEVANKLIKEFDNLVVLDKGYRKGKNDSLNYFYQQIQPKQNDVLFFTDANTFYEKDSFVRLWEELVNGAVVVGGSMKYIDQDSNSAKSEGLYWKYEEWIRRNESRFGRTITMNGGNMAMIAGYFEQLPLFVPNDFDIPIRLVSKFKTSFAKDAIGIEKAIQNSAEELTRKERMANRQMNAIILRWNQFSLITKMQLLFHKVFRWLAIPIFIMITLVRLTNDALNGNFSDISVSLLFIWVSILISIIVDKITKGQIPLLGTLSYAFWVHYYGGKGAINAFGGQRVSFWGKAASNR